MIGLVWIWFILGLVVVYYLNFYYTYYMYYLLYSMFRYILVIFISINTLLTEI